MMPGVIQVFLLSRLLLSFTHVSSFVLDGQGNVPDTLPEGSSTEQLLQVTLAEEKLLRMRLEQEVKRLNATLQEEIAARKRDVQQLKSGTTANTFYAFEAGISHDIQHPNTGQRIIFDIVRLNIGKAYNPLHGIFTAPVNGTFLFNVVFQAEGANTYVHLVKNGVCQGDAYIEFINGHWGHFARGFLLHLTSGDDVWIEDYQGSSGWLHNKATGHAPLNQFSGFLVKADM